MSKILKGLKVWWHIRRVEDLTLRIKQYERALGYLADEEVESDSKEFVSIQRKLEVIQDKRKTHYRKLRELDLIPSRRRQAC